MSSYLWAIVTASVALVVLIVFLLRAAMTARRFGGLAMAYRREVAAQAELLNSRKASLLAELASRWRRTRTMR